MINEKNSDFLGHSHSIATSCRQQTLGVNMKIELWVLFHKNVDVSIIHI